MRSPRFLDSVGIRVDESLGYPDQIGYRNGAAGCIEMLDPATGKRLSVKEVPLVIMDGTLLRQYGSNALPAFERLVAHLSRIGGAMTVLFHPDQFHNPEFPESIGVYCRLLGALRDVGATSRTALSLGSGTPNEQGPA